MAWIIIYLPMALFLLSSILAFYARKVKNKSTINFISWFLSVIVFSIITVISSFIYLEIYRVNLPLEIHWINWFVSNDFYINFTIYIDIISAIMIATISIISLFVHFYTYFYFKKEDNLSRFLAILTLFSLSMILLVTSGNLVQMFVGWEAISLCSYFLISFYYKKDHKNIASSKAFLINRFADMGFLIGIFISFFIFGSVNFSDMFINLEDVLNLYFYFFGITVNYISFIGVLFLLAAFAKSAQIFFHIWLPDAMEAPTPVSALLHAATMVTAGIFLVIKLAPLYQVSEFNNNLILIVSSITLLYGAIMACLQYDIKKIIAYSTISQLGYMFLALGILSYNAAIFHLFTHAFFKALLFLGAGAIIIAMNGEQDIRKMGGLARKISIIYIVMLIGVLSLIGIPGLSGFYSKEAILNYLFRSHLELASFAYYCAVVGILFTALYSFRLIIRVFYYQPTPIKEIGKVKIGMKFILVILSFFAIFVGKLGFPYFVGEESAIMFRGTNFNVSPLLDGSLSLKIEYTSLTLIMLAFFIIYITYIRDKNITRKLKNIFPLTYKVLYNQIYFDFIYNNLIVKTSHKVANMFTKLDEKIIDKYGVNMIANIIYSISKYTSRVQNGFVSFYAAVMVIGLIIILTFTFLLLGVN